MRLSGLHHVGITVADIRSAVEFWEQLLGMGPKFLGRSDAPYLSRVTGYEGLTVAVAMFGLPGGLELELLEYETERGVPNPEETANPGNVHICLAVDAADFESAWREAVALGGRPASNDGPASVTSGPNAGAQAGYLRIHDGVTLELRSA